MSDELQERLYKMYCEKNEISELESTQFRNFLNTKISQKLYINKILSLMIKYSSFDIKIDKVSYQIYTFFNFIKNELTPQYEIFKKRNEEITKIIKPVESEESSWFIDSLYIADKEIDTLNYNLTNVYDYYQKIFDRMMYDNKELNFENIQKFLKSVSRSSFLFYYSYFIDNYNYAVKYTHDSIEELRRYQIGCCVATSTFNLLEDQIMFMIKFKNMLENIQI